MTSTETAPHPGPRSDEATRKLAIICSKGTPTSLTPVSCSRAQRWVRASIEPSDGQTVADLGIPDVPGLPRQIVDSGGHLRARRMSADMQRVTEDDLYREAEGIITRPTSSRRPMSRRRHSGDSWVLADP